MKIRGGQEHDLLIEDAISLGMQRGLFRIEWRGTKDGRITGRLPFDRDTIENMELMMGEVAESFGAPSLTSAERALVEGFGGVTLITISDGGRIEYLWLIKSEVERVTNYLLR